MNKRSSSRRRKVSEQVLASWHAARQEQAMIEQYSEVPTKAEAKEIEAWRAIQAAAVARLFRLP